MKMVVASELGDKDKDASNNEGSLGSCGLEKDRFSSGDDAVGADNEDGAEPREDDNDSAAEARVGTNTGWADAMARILNKKIPESKPTILVRNRELEKEKEKLKQERLEKRKQLDKKREGNDVQSKARCCQRQRNGGKSSENCYEGCGAVI